MMTNEQIEQLSPEIREAIDRGRVALDEVDKTVQRLIADKPLLLLGGTLLAGYVVGRVLGKKL